MDKQHIKQLPEYPSELLQLALDDISVIKKDKRYKIDLYYWHKPNKDTNTCYVCLAGAVLVNTLKFDIKNIVPYDFSSAQGEIGKDNLKKLRTIDILRHLHLLLYVYQDYKKSVGQILTDEEKDVVEKRQEEMYRKLEKFDNHKGAIYEFKNFEKSYEFFSSIVEDIEYLDKKILGKK